MRLFERCKKCYKECAPQLSYYLGNRSSAVAMDTSLARTPGLPLARVVSPEHCAWTTMAAGERYA